MQSTLRVSYLVPTRLALSIHNADIGQVAIFLGVVRTVAGHEHVADRETDKINCDLDLASLRLVEQRACPEVADPVLAQAGGGKSDRPAGIDDVIDQQYRPPGKPGRHLTKKPHGTAALLGRTIAAEPD